MYIVIGAPGEGKTPFCKKMIAGNRCFVFDINDEYGNRTKYPGQEKVGLSNNVHDLRSRYIGDDVNVFLKHALTKRSTTIVFEEATAFFEGKTNQLTRRLIINRHHTQNVYLFLFHSINSVPPRIMEMANYVVLFKTNDEMDNVYRKFSRLGPSFDELQRYPSGSGHKIILKLL